MTLSRYTGSRPRTPQGLPKLERFVVPSDPFKLMDGAKRGKDEGKHIEPKEVLLHAASMDSAFASILGVFGQRDVLVAQDVTENETHFSPACPWVFMMGLVGFGLVASDVFGDYSPHILSSMDSGIHQWVVEHVPKVVQDTFFEYWLSCTFIVPETVLWPILSVVTLLGAPIEGAVMIALSGLCLKSHSWAVDGLKIFFQRPRPGGLRKNFSFPSGHTTAAVFTTGAILFVLLPAAFAVLNRDEDSGRASPSQFEFGVRKYAPYIWSFSYVATAAGRMGADAHWFSDTLGGMCLGVALVSILAGSIEAMRKAMGNKTLD